MQFGSRNKRNTTFYLLVLFLLEAGLAALIAYYLELGFGGFWIVLPGLLLLYLVVWIKNSLIAWAMFMFFSRRALATQVAEYFKTSGFPEPDEYELTPDDYLLRTMSDGNQPVEVRLDAAASLSELSTLKNFGFMQACMRARMVYEDALEAYKALSKQAR
jgi:hypothetical protein